MAYVSISRDLIERLRTTVDGMRTTEIRAEIPQELPPIGDASDLYNLGCWGKDRVHLINTIPHDWLCAEETPTIRAKGLVLDSDGNEITVTADASFKGATHAYRRPSTSYYDRITSEFNIEELRALPETYFGRDYLISEYDKAVTTALIKARWNKIKEEMCTFLHKCKSLNEAVKLFPGVKMYLDRADVQRLEHKPQRQPREELLAGVDTGAMTAAAIVAKLTAGAEA